MLAMAFQAGQVVGEYKVTGVLGRGGLGAVYGATHLISQRAEALKVLLAEQTGTAEMAERFRREIQLLASLNHANIARLLNAFYFQEQLVMVMELVEGEDLLTCSRRTRIPLPALIDYAQQVLAGLEYAHGRGVVHRDIKPANIMITPAGVVKILDFGIAVAASSADLTVAGSLIGSPTHMSPEQVRGEKATVQSDIYSLGMTLYELIAGVLPYEWKTSYDLLMAHLHQVPRPLHAVRSDIPAALSDAVARALEKEPARRFASAEEFRAALAGDNFAELAMLTTLAPGSSPRPSGAASPSRPSAFTPSANEPPPSLVRHLATFIGPIAKVVATRLSRQTSDVDQMYALAAKEIDSEAERQRFLRTRPRQP